MVPCCHMIHFLLRSFIKCQCLVHLKTVQHGRFGIHQYHKFLSYSKELSVFMEGGAHDSGHSLGLEWRRCFQNSDSHCWWLCHLHWLAGLIWHFGGRPTCCHADPAKWSEHPLWADSGMPTFSVLAWCFSRVFHSFLSVLQFFIQLCFESRQCCFLSC